eukprot:12864999-Alexandrium_andersonii.AAC.1
MEGTSPTGLTQRGRTFTPNSKMHARVLIRALRPELLPVPSRPPLRALHDAPKHSLCTLYNDTPRGPDVHAAG